MTVRTKTVQLPLLRCFAAILYKMPVWTEGRPRYFAALLQSMPAWTQHISRCFVASLQSYIRCQSELKAAPATSLLRCFVTIYASLNPTHLSLLRCFAAILYKMPCCVGCSNFLMPRCNGWSVVMIMTILNILSLKLILKIFKIILTLPPNK